MADATILHAASVTANTATSATWVEAVSIAAGSFTVGRDYVLIAVLNLDSSAGTSDCGYRFVHGTTPTEFTDAVGHMDPVSSDEARPQIFIQRFTQPNPAEAVTLQFNLREGTGTITQMYADIIAFDITADWTENTNFFWDEDTGDTADAATLTARAAITFSANGTDKWLIAGQASWNVATTGVAFAMCLNDSVGPTKYGDSTPLGYPSQDTDDLFNFGYLVGLTPTNGSHTFSVLTQSATTEAVLSSRIVAFNLTALFQDVAIAYTAAADNPTADGTTWETEQSLSVTPTATGNFVIFANAVASIAAAGDNCLARLQINPDGGGLVSDPAYGDDGPDNFASSISRGMPFELQTVRSLTTGAARPINFDWKQASGGTSAVRERALIAFSVAKAGAPPPVVVKTLAALGVG